MKNDALKKHHFWILLGLVPLCVLIAVLMVSSSVGKEIEKRQGEIDKATKDIASKNNPKSKALLDQMERTISAVAGKQDDLWKMNWERQKNLYTWPRSAGFADFIRKDRNAEGKEVETPVRLESLKFGDPIPNNNSQFSEFAKPEFYRALYSNANPKKNIPGTTGMADRIAPTQFKLGWENVLRHVNQWPQAQLTSDQVWMLMEDVWVQRSLLEAIKAVNTQMAEFAPARLEQNGKIIDDPAWKPAERPKLERRFKSRTWDVELKVTERDGKYVLSGKLKNHTDRLQLMGITTNKKGERVNGLTLKVWLSPATLKDANFKPFELKVSGDFLPGQGAMKPVLGEDGKPLKDKDNRDLMVPANVTDLTTVDPEGNEIPPGTNVDEIVKVEQVFDIRTVPIRQISALELGFPDSRTVATALKKPLHIQKLDEAAAAAAPAQTETGEGGLTPGSTINLGGPGSGGRPQFPGVGMPAPGGFGEGSTLGGGGGAGGRGGGTVESQVDARVKRYVDVTPQVRRMPVGIVVVVDQAYLQDVLVALANSPLRFQVTQVTWKRFRDPIDTGLPGTSSPTYPGEGGSSGVVVSSGPGNLGGGITLGPGGFGEGGEGGGPGPGFGPGGFAGPRGPGPGGGGPIMVGPGPGGYGPGGYGPGGPGGYGPGFGGGGAITSVSEAQLTSGLIELSVYGVMSLYTMYTPPEAPKDGDPTATATPKDGELKDKKDADPKDNGKDKEPKKDPMSSGTTPPKMRRRARA